MGRPAGDSPGRLYAGARPVQQQRPPSRVCAGLDDPVLDVPGQPVVPVRLRRGNHSTQADADRRTRQPWLDVLSRPCPVGRWVWRGGVNGVVGARSPGPSTGCRSGGPENPDPGNDPGGHISNSVVAAWPNSTDDRPQIFPREVPSAHGNGTDQPGGGAGRRPPIPG